MIMDIRQWQEYCTNKKVKEVRHVKIIDLSSGHPLPCPGCFVHHLDQVQCVCVCGQKGYLRGSVKLTLETVCFFHFLPIASVLLSELSTELLFFYWVSNFVFSSFKNNCLWMSWCQKYHSLVSGRRTPWTGTPTSKDVLLHRQGPGSRDHTPLLSWHRRVGHSSPESQLPGSSQAWVWWSLETKDLLVSVHKSLHFQDCIFYGLLFLEIL